MSGARIGEGAGAINVATGVPVLDHLLTELARAGGFDLTLEIEPDDPEAEVDERDGLRLGWADRWLHLRPSGTEPIVRLIAEAPTAGEAEALIQGTRALLGAPS